LNYGYYLFIAYLDFGTVIGLQRKVVRLLVISRAAEPRVTQIYPQVTGSLFVLRLSGLWWWYCNPPPHRASLQRGVAKYKKGNETYEPEKNTLKMKPKKI
jgi:hypothetical protein